MIDKLKIVLNENVSSSQIHDTASEISQLKVFVPDKIYNKSFNYQVDSSVQFCLKTNPRLPSVKPISIELNPSKFSSLAELDSLLKRLTPLEGSRITRIDYASDLNQDLGSIWRQIDVSYKSIRDRYRGSKLDGLYFGTGNHNICIYDKSPKYKPSSVTRFEIREKMDQVSFKNVSDLKLILGFNPFLCIKIMSLNPPPERGSPRCYESLKSLIEVNGLFSARKQLGEKNNFNKTYGKYLSLSPLNESLFMEFQKNLEQFMGAK
jgi:hypothetical protein